MLKAKKGNRVVRIPEEKVDEYKALGYTITDMSGNMIYEHVEPSEKLKAAEKELDTLKKEVSSLKEKLDEAEKYAEAADKKIEALEAENARLKGTEGAAEKSAGTKKTGKAAESGK